MAHEKNNTSVTIPAGESVSNELDVGYFVYIAAFCAASSRDGTHLKAELSPDGVTWSTLPGYLGPFDSATAFAIPFGGLQLCRKVRLRSCDSNGVPVVEAAGLTIKVVLSNQGMV